jgi:hypothetical protein
LILIVLMSFPKIKRDVPSSTIVMFDPRIKKKHWPCYPEIWIITLLQYMVYLPSLGFWVDCQMPLSPWISSNLSNQVLFFALDSESWMIKLFPSWKN